MNQWLKKYQRGGESSFYQPYHQSPQRSDNTKVVLNLPQGRTVVAAPEKHSVEELNQKVKAKKEADKREIQRRKDAIKRSIHNDINNAV